MENFVIQKQPRSWGAEQACAVRFGEVDASEKRHRPGAGFGGTPHPRSFSQTRGVPVPICARREVFPSRFSGIWDLSPVASYATGGI